MAKDTRNPVDFGPPTKPVPPFPQAGSAMQRQVPAAKPQAAKPPPPSRDRHKSKAGRTKHS